MKIALIGAAPSSVNLAPYESDEWTIWGCSGSVYPVARRTDAWFEVHLYDPGGPRFGEGYSKFLANYPGTVWMMKKHPAVPNSEDLPVDELIEKYGPYVFTSTIAWMFAMAIEMGATTIGLWGIDMAAQGEYGYQRSALQFLAQIAKNKGISVGVPPQSDLFRPPVAYGLCEFSHQYQKMQIRQLELKQRHDQLEMELDHKRNELWFLKGALDDMSYHQENWLGDPRIQDQEFCTVPEAEGLSDMPIAVEGNPAVIDEIDVIDPKIADHITGKKPGEVTWFEGKDIPTFGKKDA